MLRTIEAVIEPNGSVRLLEPLFLTTAHRALVTVLEESSDEAGDNGTAPLSEQVLAKWTREEEDLTWARNRAGESHLRGLSSADLRSLAGTIAPGDLDVMERVIEEEFERVDPHGW
jgi:hypothetical protein